MTRSLPPHTEAAFWLLLTAVGYYLLASLSLYATKGADDIAAIWPPSGYFLALLLLMPTRARLMAFAGMATASIAANMLVGGSSLLISAGFTVANAGEAVIALWVLRIGGQGDLSFMVPGAVAKFCAAAIIGSLTGGAFAALLTGSGQNFFLSWATTVALGMLIVTPMIVIFARMIASGAIQNVSTRMKLESVVILLGVALITGATFSQSLFPGTFVPCLAVILAAFRLGPFGAAASVLVVTIVTSLMTAHGYGPIAAIEAEPKVHVYFLQFYLLALLFTALTLAALTVMHRRLAKRLEQSNRLLLQAEAAALVGHWRVDLVNWTIQWSDQTYRVHGLEPGTPVDVEYSVDRYVDEDGQEVRRILEDAVRTGEPFEYQGRILRPDGVVRHVKSHGSIEFGRRGRASAIFGTVQDVTEMVENARVLEAARSAAERIANTDMLTGLPNRRHTLADLEAALAAARDGDGALAVAIFDIDHFKRVNDNYGHAAGDAVIRRVAHRARGALRDVDLIGRVGGEEFVCILRDSSAQAAEIVAERIRKAVESEAGLAADAPRVTISVGLARFNGDADIEELMHRADEALYRAKRDGRNRVGMAA